MLDILISSSVLILVLAVLRFALRNRISARLQYALWLLVLLRLLVPVSLFHSPVSVAEAAAPVTERAWTASHRVLYAWNTPGSAPPEPAGVSTQLDEGGVINSGQVLILRDALLFIWYLGIAVMAAWFLFVNMRLARRLKKYRAPYDSDSVLPVYVTDVIPSPCLFGLFRPSIYLTDRAAEDETRARQIVAHEQTHYRHGDMIWSLLRSVCLAVWWFNPLVWLAAALSRQDCELACDEGTIKALGEEARFDYGRTLVSMARVGARPSDLLCGATTMTTGRKSLKARVARIANAPKRSAAVAAAVLLIAAVTVGCTFAGAAESVPVEPEVAVDVPASASSTDAEALPMAYSLLILDPDSGEVLSVESSSRSELEDLYVLYGDLRKLARPMTAGDVFSEDERSYFVRFFRDNGFGFTPGDDYTGFQMWEDGTFLLFEGDVGGSPTGVCVMKPYAEAFLDILDEYHSESAEADFVSGEPLGAYNREYWDEVDREFAGFLSGENVEVFVSEYFDEALPEDDIFGPLTLADYVFGTDGWKFRYKGELPANDPAAAIKVHDADGRTLWIMDDADALMIEEADGSATWVTYASDPVDCADMIRHLLPWARREYPTEEELAAQREAQMELSAQNAIAELGCFGLPGPEPVHREGGTATPFWADLSDLSSGPYVALYYGTDEMTADLRYERVYGEGDPGRPLGADAYEMCRAFFAASETETVSDLQIDSLRGFVTDGSVYHGPRLVWYDEANDLLFSLIAFHCDGGQPTGSYSAEELVGLAQSVAPLP